MTLLAASFCGLVLSGQESEQKPREQGARFKARVDEVVVYASVYNASAQLVSGLTQDDFQVFEDKTLQALKSFAQTEVPSTIGIVLDSSGSMRNKQTMVEEAVDLFLELTHPENELFLIRFDDEVELEEDFTNDVEDIRDAIQNIVVKGGTALYDATYLSVDKAQNGTEPRRILVVFTDGEDKDSYYQFEEVLDKVQESDTQIFIVAFLDEELSDEGGFFGIFKSDREKVQRRLAELADVTGGKAYFPDKIEELNGIFEAIAYDLKNQYRLTYTSSNPVRDGKWRRVDVKVKNARERGLRVRARKGYYAREPEIRAPSDPPRTPGF